MSRNLVICLDGTRNEPGGSPSNILRLHDVVAKSDEQLVYYDPGVGTIGGRAVFTEVGRVATKGLGAIAGFGILENIEEAYTWLSENYRPGDRIHVFGYSRGAYTARALTGMLRTVGLLRRGSANLVPYAIKLYVRSDPWQPAGADPDGLPDETSTRAARVFWRERSRFRAQFGNPDFPHPFDSRHQVEFLGVWDTVKSVGSVDLQGRVRIAQWPFTARIVNVGAARHALAIDERRRFLEPYRFDPTLVAGSPDRYRELWFAGTHSDIGGLPPDSRLSDLAFAWIVRDAVACGLTIDHSRYRRLLGVSVGEDLPIDYATGEIRANPRMWWLAGGWRPRTMRPDDRVHPSVLRRVAATAGNRRPYRPQLANHRSIESIPSIAG